MTMIEELVKQRIEGTDNLSLAQGIAHGVLSTLTGAASEISDNLFEANCNAKELLKGVRQNINFVFHNLKILEDEIKNFESTCARIRAEVERLNTSA